jgi:hypothetical protein
LRKRHGEPISAEVTPEVLAKQHLDIRLIIDHENKQVHGRPPDLASDAATRGRYFDPVAEISRRCRKGGLVAPVIGLPPVFGRGIKPV